MTNGQTRLTIRFQGDEPSLRQHRLSLTTFAGPLGRLASALRRIASGIDSDAWGPAEYGSRGGRLTHETRGVDWEISTLNGFHQNEKGPLELSGVVVQRYETPLPLRWPESTDLTDLAAERLLEALEKESRGQSISMVVREYLSSLPASVVHQEYEVSTTGGKTLDKVVIGEVNLPKEESALPHLAEVEGNLVGVGFEPGQNEVRLKIAGAPALTLSASAEQVEDSLALRGDSVAALFVYSPGAKKSRLLNIRPYDTPRRIVSSEEAEAKVLEQWGGLLKRLEE